MNFVYVLQCENDKFYVGQTSNIVRRFEEHKNGEGSSWTKKHRATAMVDLMQTSLNDFREVALTLQYMSKYGISNVRGGPFSRVELNSTDIKCIVSMMKNNAFPKQWSPLDCDKQLFEYKEEEEEDEDGGKRKRLRTLRCGLAWTQSEDDILYDRLNVQRLAIDECASLHERSANSIRARIVVLVKKSSVEETYLKTLL